MAKKEPKGLDYYVSDEAKQRVAKQDLKEREAADAKRLKNVDFVQIDRRSMKLVAQLFEDSPTAGKLLMLMGSKMNRQNALVCSYATMTAMTGLSRTTLHKAIKHLKEHNWIQVIKVGTANAYVINSKIFWRSYGDRKMAVFHATVVASKDEQDPDEDWENVQVKHFPFYGEKEVNNTLLTGEDPPPPEQTDMFINQNENSK